MKTNLVYNNSCTIVLLQLCFMYVELDWVTAYAKQKEEAHKTEELKVIYEIFVITR